jgi:prevent-host-death family protein
MKHDHVAAEEALVITATEFKAKCLDLLDQVNSHRLRSVTVTKRGKPVAVLRAPDVQEKPSWEGVFGSMKDRTILPPDFDPTAPVFDGVWDEDAAEWRFP